MLSALGFCDCDMQVLVAPCVLGTLGMNGVSGELWLRATWYQCFLKVLETACELFLPLPSTCKKVMENKLGLHFL